MSLSFTFVDLLVIGTIIISTWHAAYKGFVSETLSIVAWAAAAFTTLWFGATAEPLARSFVSSPIFATVLSYAMVFLIVLLPLQFLSSRFSQQVKSSSVGTLDSTLGGAFGVVRGLAIIGFAYLILESFIRFADQPESVQQARTLPLIQASTEVILTLVPERKTADDANTVAVNRDNQRQQAEIAPKPKPDAAKSKSSHKRQKAYGARDRRALDSLIETTGGNSTP